MAQNCVKLVDLVSGRFPRGYRAVIDAPLHSWPPLQRAHVGLGNSHSFQNSPCAALMYTCGQVGTETTEGHGAKKEA